MIQSCMVGTNVRFIEIFLIMPNKKFVIHKNLHLIKLDPTHVAVLYSN